MRILLIEDDVDVIETIKSILTGFYQGIDVKCILDGDEFRRGSWRRNDWSLIVLDLMIPGITGFEVCEMLRSFSGTRLAPILALTGYDTVQNEEKIKQAGATSYLAKPFEVQRFIEEINRLVK